MTCWAQIKDMVGNMAHITRNLGNPQMAATLPNLTVAGHLVANWPMPRSVLSAKTHAGDLAFAQTKTASVRFFAHHIPTKTALQRACVTHRATSLLCPAP
ncbi:MAG: acyl-CoA dehydrogenase C-terminal domain-containing protein [Paracoccaceae bacterium]